jgi:hypothetical protein
MVEEPRYWYNLRTGTVQTDEDKGQGKHLMGPYPTAEEAARALRAASERTERWDEEDRRWDEGDGPPRP